MKAVGYQQCFSADNPHSLVDIELEKPVAKGRDLLVAVHGISVNPTDYKFRQKAPPARGQWRVLGFDATGVVEEVGSDVTLFKPGDKVWYAGDMTRQGSNAQYQLVDERLVGTMPQTLPFAEAAALPLTAITAWEILFDRLNIDRNDPSKSVLVIGAAGGVGSILVQLIKRLTQLTLVGTASRPETTNWLKELGVDYVLNHHNPLSSEYMRYKLPESDYVISLNGTEQHLPEIIKVIKPQGAFSLIDDAEVINLMPFKQKSLSVHWELMFTRPMFQTPDMQRQHEILNEVAAMVDRGEIRTTMAEHMGLINAANLRRAHQVLEKRRARGKIVLADF